MPGTNPIPKQYKTSQGPSWTRFFSQIVKDLRLYVYCMITLSAFRIVLITTFLGRKAPSSTWPDFFTTLANGMRFDSRISVFVMLPSLISSILCGFFDLKKAGDRIRLYTAIFFTVITVIICGIDIPFFAEYNDQFNHWIFGLIYDDLNAILKTAWAQVPLIRILIIGILLTTALIFILKRFLNPEPGAAWRTQSLPAWEKTAATVLVILFFIAAGRGSIWRRPVQLKDAAVTRDPFLNKTILNPYEAIRYLLAAERKKESTTGIRTFLPDGDIRSAVTDYFNDKRKSEDLDRYMLRIAKGNVSPRPKHIFVFVMESYNSWTLLDKYASLGTCEKVRDLAARGIWIKRFLPASVGTTPALTTIITGLPATGVHTNYQPSARKPYPTSIAPIFKALGYKTIFFYGGYLSWQRIGDFCRDQGFDAVYGAPSMGSWTHADEWGVDDEFLFNFMEKTIHDDTPTFSLIMSTTYHAPYDIDVFSKGYPVKKIPADLANMYDGETTMKMFGHLWYADRHLGELIRHLEKKLSNPVFLITGDHYSRKFLNGRPSVYEGSSVPCVIYGPSVLRGVHAGKNALGSHVDIAPTLVELAAPTGFVYHSLGRNMLGTTPPDLAFGSDGVIMGKNFVEETKKTIRPGPVPGFPFIPPDTDALTQKASEYYAISWWRVMRGNKLPAGN